MANLLTALRLLLILPVTVGFAVPGSITPLMLLSLILVAIGTDYFDGIVARKTGTASAKGQLFDHATDCLFVTTGLAGAAWSGSLPLILPVLVIIAFTQYVLDSHWYYKQKSLRMSFIGRWNGVFYFGPVLLLAMAGVIAVENISQILNLAAVVLAYFLVITTLVSILDRALAPLRKASKSNV